MQRVLLSRSLHVCAVYASVCVCASEACKKGICCMLQAYAAAVAAAAKTPQLCIIKNGVRISHGATQLIQNFFNYFRLPSSPSLSLSLSRSVP